MAKALFRKTILKSVLTGALAACAALPLAAQGFSEGYEFLKAVKDRDGERVTQALSEPAGSTLVNTRDVSTGQSALHIVTQRRDTAWIRFLTQNGANPNIRDEQGVTPLVIASNLGFVEGIEALLDAGARVDEANDAGETPLISAVHRRDLAMVRLLLDSGANPGRNDNSGRSARDYAELLSSDTIADAIRDADGKRKAGSEAKTYGPTA